MTELNSRLLLTALGIWGFAGQGLLGCTDGAALCNSDCGGAAGAAGTAGSHAPGGEGGGSGDPGAGRAGAAVSLAGSSAGGSAGAADEAAAGACEQAGDSSGTSGSAGALVVNGGSSGESLGGSSGGSVGGSSGESLGGSSGGSVGGSSGESFSGSGGGSFSGSGGAGGTDNPDSPLSIGPALLPYAGLHAAYRAQLVAIGGSGAGYVFSVSSGSVPAELSLAADGTLSGVPQQEGVFDFVVSVIDSHGNHGQASLELKVTQHRWLAYQLVPFLPLPALNLLNMNADGYPTTTLPSVRSFKFSPDGHWLLYSTKTELDVLDVSGGSLGAPVPLATGSFDQLKWSPDNDWVAYHDTASDQFRALRTSTGASVTLGSQAPDFVASRWGTRVVYCQTVNTSVTLTPKIVYVYSYVDLKNVTPSVPATAQVLATRSELGGGWVGDQQYVIAGYSGDGGIAYVKFGPTGVESVNALSTSFSAYFTSFARHDSPAIVLVSQDTAPGYPNLWFNFDTGQRVDWPSLADNPPLSYSGSLSKFAIEGASGQAQIFQASLPHGTVLGSAPFRHGQSLDSQLVAWSPTEDTVASVDWDNQVWVTWLDSSGVSLLAKNVVGSDVGVGGFNFGAQGDWVSFDAYPNSSWHRWFVAIRGKTLTPPQEFLEAQSSAPVEAPDRRTVALFDGWGLNLFPVSAGVLGTPHSFNALPNVRGDVLGAQWSTDSAHFVASPSNDPNGNYQLFIVDATSATATPKMLGTTSPGNYSVQP